MDAILTELVLHANGKYTFSHLLNTLDELKRMKKITVQQHEEAYKKMIQESRKGDKWYEKYLNNGMLNNFSFDVNKYNDENDPKFANQSEKKTAFVSKSTDSHKFVSPPMFVTPPTFETRYSRQSDYQSEHQKKLTNLILQQMQEQSEKKKVNQSIQVYIDSAGFEKLRNFYNRKVLQHFRFIFNKLIYLINEPVKITRFSTKDRQVVEKLISDFLVQRNIKIKFDYFDCLKQNWIRKKRLHVIENGILSLRKTRYLQRSFYKMKNYSCKHKIRRFYKSQASYQFIKNTITKVWSQWIIFHHTRLEKNLYTKVLKKYVGAKHHAQKQECFLKLKKNYQKRKNKKCEDLLSIKVHNRKVCKLIFSRWSLYVKEINNNHINNALIRRGLKAFVLNRNNNVIYRVKIEQAINQHRKQAKRQVYRVIKNYYAQTNKKKIFRLTLHQFHETQIQKLVFIGFKKALVNRHIKRKLNKVLFNHLITRYLKNPLQILIQYKEHRDVKTQLKLKVQSIYANKVTKEVFFGLKYWFYLRKYHQRRDRELLPQISVVTQRIVIKRLQLSYQQSLQLKKFIQLIRNKHSKNILKELKINLIRFKQQNKYPLKIKRIVFNSFKLMMKKRFQKLVFQNQLFSLHHMNLLKKSFLHLKKRGQYYHQKQINIRSLKRYLLGKYIAAPFFSWLEKKRKNKYRRSITQNSYKLRVIKLYQKSFTILNNYRWKKKLQKVKDQQSVPTLLRLNKLKILKFWQRKLQSAYKIHNFCNNFENMQLRILFKHMKLIKLRDFQKKKIMKQGRLIFLMRRAFKHLSGYRNMKHRDYRNTELIIQRQEHRLKLNSYNQMKRIFTAEQNIAYLTAFTILDIKRTILTKYFEGFKHMIQAKKRPRDYNLKIKRTRNYFKLWKRFVQRQQAIKELYKVLAIYKTKQKQKFVNKLSKNCKLSYANENLQFRKIQLIMLNWRDMTKIKQKTIYFQKVLRLIFQQKKLQYFNHFKVSLKQLSVEKSIIFNQKSRLFKKWRSMQIKRQQSEVIFQIIESQIQKRQQKSLQLLGQNNISQQIQFNKLYKIFKQWNRQSNKNQSCQQLTNILQKLTTQQSANTFHRLKQYNQRVQFNQQQQFRTLFNIFKTWRLVVDSKNKKVSACGQFLQIFNQIIKKNKLKCLDKVKENNKILKINMRKQQLMFLKWRIQVESRINIRFFTQIVNAAFQKRKIDSFNILKYNQKKQQATSKIFQIMAKNIQSTFTKMYFKKQGFIKIKKLNRKVSSIQRVFNTIENYFNDQKQIVLLKLNRRSRDFRNKQIIRKVVKQRFITKWFKQAIKMQATQKIIQLLPLIQNMHNLQKIKLQQKFFDRLVNNKKIQLFEEQKNFRIIRQYFYCLNILRAQKTGVQIITYNLQQMINNYTSHNLEVLKKQILKNQYYIQKIRDVSFKLEKQALIEDLKSLNLYVTNQENKIEQIKQNSKKRTLKKFLQFYITKFNLRQLQYEGIDKVGDIHIRFMRRSFGIEFIKNLKLLRKQVQQKEAERNIHLRKAVFTSWKMMAEEKKMLKKYLEESEKYENQHR